MPRSPRWRVVIVDDHERSRAALRAAIGAAGGEIAGEAVRAAGARDLVRRVRPEVAILAVGLADGDGLTVAGDVVAENVPVVLFTSRTGDAVVERARVAGVMAFLLKPLRADELTPALDLAIARFRELRALEQRLEQRKTIERAKGRLMTRYGLAEDEAFRRLRRAAMDSRQPMAEVARALLLSDSVAGDATT
jgi:response regulator NasT